MRRRVQLLPAVAIAAGALLSIKVAGVWLGGGWWFAFDHPPDIEITGSTAPAKEKPKPPPEPPAGKPVNLDQAPVSAERGILEKLGQRRQELEERQRELDTREQLLKAADKKLEDRLNELKQLEQKPPGAPDQVAGVPGQPGHAEAQPSIRNLVTMYEAMKPKDAAKVFDRLDLRVLVPVVTAMNPKKMSEVLAAMTPEAAGKLTVELAMRSLKGTAPPKPATDPSLLPAGELQAIDPKRQ
jgi:flagellar motility protein MotE (MotC chaperone)